MGARSYTLAFDGYWREPNVGSIPAKSGVYAVYACTFDATQKTVSLKRLLYIGEAADMCGRVTDHDRLQDWKRRLKQGEVICVTAAMINPEANRQRAEAAMIFKHKPACNTEYVNVFPFDATSITTSGKNALVESSFTVTPTEKAAVAGNGRW